MQCEHCERRAGRFGASAGNRAFIAAAVARRLDQRRESRGQQPPESKSGTSCGRASAACRIAAQSSLDAKRESADSQLAACAYGCSPSFPDFGFGGWGV